MNANPILLQKKYARVVELYTKENGISLEKALDVFTVPCCITSRASGIRPALYE